MEYGYESKLDDSLPQSDETSKNVEAAFDFEDLEEGGDISVDVADNVDVQTEDLEIIEDDCSNPNDWVIDTGDNRVSLPEIIEQNGNNETKEMIQHRELDDALLTSQIHYAEGQKSIGDKLQSGDYSVCDPLAIKHELDDIKMKCKKDENEIYAFRHVNKWGTANYTEEYSPDQDE